MFYFLCLLFLFSLSLFLLYYSHWHFVLKSLLYIILFSEGFSLNFLGFILNLYFEFLSLTFVPLLDFYLSHKASIQKTVNFIYTLKLNEWIKINAGKTLLCLVTGNVALNIFGVVLTLETKCQDTCVCFCNFNDYVFIIMVYVRCHVIFYNYMN